MNEKKIRCVVHFHGNVQGVGFRANAMYESAGLDIAGFVRNEPNGSVTMDIVGLQPDIDELIRRIQSSMRQNIDDVEIEKRETETLEAGVRPKGLRIR
ncbi:Acylphosphatase [Planctomycetes bacterium CA13]|uniref:acylphosphatase n=1 Tax=Novipirellula herctigrandis TaxID=2527986 RepID=A0A5C5ZC37_9BACT|nr:Acylphosphatase [Planctomycetes bacterium CA13]